MLVDSNRVETQSTLRGEKIQMGIASDAAAHLMGILANMYSDQEMALIREYSVNAADAHAEAGNILPIEVTTPTNLAPFLKIKDSGIGLDIEDIRTIYSQYGASTKRNTNEQTGSLGIGCKSALSYTSQFTVVSVKRGIRYQVSISRSENGGGDMTVVSQDPTTDSDGTEVIIPAKRFNDIEKKAKEFFAFWGPHTVLLNGESPKRLEGLHLTDDVLITQELERNYVVMGGVPYPASLNLNLGSGNAVVFVEMNSVSFTPSREELMYNAKTKTKLASIANEFARLAPEAIQRDIDVAKTHADALRVMSQWRQVVPNLAKKVVFTHNGVEIPQEFSAGLDSLNHARVFCISPINSSKLSERMTRPKIQASWMACGILVHGYTLNFTPGHKKKLKKWVEDNQIQDVERFILCQDIPEGAEWIQPERIVDWETIKAIKLPTNRKSASGRIAGSYDIYDSKGDYQEGIEAHTFDPNRLLWMIALSSNKNHYESTLARLALKYKRGYSVVVFSPNRQAKFCRSFPKAARVRDVLQKVYDSKYSKIPESEVKARIAKNVAYRYGEYKGIDPARVDDPKVVEVIEYLKNQTGDSKALDALVNEFSVAGGPSNRVPAPENLGDPLDNYPLWNSYRFREHPDHMYIYLNAAYAAKEAKNV